MYIVNTIWREHYFVCLRLYIRTSDFVSRMRRCVQVKGRKHSVVCPRNDGARIRINYTFKHVVNWKIIVGVCTLWYVSVRINIYVRVTIFAWHFHEPDYIFSSQNVKLNYFNSCLTRVQVYCVG